MMGSIYYIGCSQTEAVKIGFTAGKPEARLSALQTGSPTKLVLIATHRGTIEDERKLHAQFEADRRRGEWFNLSEELVMHMMAVVWLGAVDCSKRGSRPPKWMKAGLEAMAEISPLPDDLAALA